MIISLAAKGLTTGEISAHLAEVYGAQVSRQTISAITGKVIDGMAERQNRPLDPVCPVIFIDAIHVKICDGQVANRPIHVAMAVTLDGERDILGLWAGDGGEGVPEEVSGHPRMFATFTVPSFGVVHAHRSGENGKPLPCRPRRDRPVREHRRPESRGARHDSDAPQVGQPLCVDCYDYRDTGLR